MGNTMDVMEAAGARRRRLVPGLPYVAMCGLVGFTPAPPKVAGPSITAEQVSILGAFTLGLKKDPSFITGIDTKKVKVVYFFDNDGVFNVNDPPNFHPDKIARGRRIVEETPGGYWMGSSSHRLGHTAESYREMMGKAGMNTDRFLGITGYISDIARGSEILEAMKIRFGGKHVKVVIFDDLGTPGMDMTPFNKVHIKTDTAIGLTENQVKAALEIAKTDLPGDYGVHMRKRMS